MKDKAAGRRRLLKLALIFGCWTLFGLFFASQEYVRYAYAGRPVELVRMLLAWLGSAYVWAALTPLIFYLTRRFPIERTRLSRGLLVHLPASVLFSCVELLAFIVIAPLLGLPPLKNSFSETFVTVFVIDFHFNLLTYWAILGCSLALDYYRKYQERKLRASQLELRTSHLETRDATGYYIVAPLGLLSNCFLNLYGPATVLLKTIAGPGFEGVDGKSSSLTDEGHFRATFGAEFCRVFRLVPATGAGQWLRLGRSSTFRAELGFPHGCPAG